ncbi:MAG: hypothetical protein JJU13_05000 [Balneolaceae bacterium]|nr:hypothetical protein [Balneolaceae bacterium]
MKKKILILISSCAFAALMLFNVSVSIENSGMETDISLSGISALAVSSGECTGGCSGCFGWGGTCHDSSDSWYCGAIVPVGGGTTTYCYRPNY